jgi:diphosphate-dependent phosphofructokinase
MAAAAVTANGTANGPAPGRLASVYSEVQTSRLLHSLPLPSVLRSNFTVADGPASSAAGNPGERTRLPYAWFSLDLVARA